MVAKKSDFPSVLAFERKLNPSDGFLYGTRWNDKGNAVPLKLVEKSVRGTISNRLKTAISGDPLKLNSEVQKPNLQTVDFCALPQDCDTLKMVFTVKVLGKVGEPSSCNMADFQNKLRSAVSAYSNTFGFKELGKRYAYNIASGRFLWRNRVGAEAIQVYVKVLGSEKAWVFDGKTYPIRTFDKSDEKIVALGELIADTLSGSESVTLEVTTYAKIENGQEVFPSEELVLDKGKNSSKSKILYAVDGIAAVHSQKIGNALRTVDTWYPEYTDPVNGAGPIAAEPYGAVTNMGKAFRNPKDKVDFYTLFDRFTCGTPLDNDNDKHYVMSVLIRGGVFGKGDKE
ncbi:type I-F CRISPR-associated protein Csy3 [Succinimonas amylolytica]|uniref:type I-F CRISPR-associated protein Csy3 n=1 Tax=Succinimonas amylolytica TaxID=83769 RepID=UPI00037527D0|nr:type I-F CRISPR-associated protein Csy3 [Succinimonas amylolytica]